MINPLTEPQYSLRINPADGDYSYGKTKARTVQGASDGTPLTERWELDLWGFEQAIMLGATIVPDGNPDTQNASQRLTGLKRIMRYERSSTSIFAAQVGTGSELGHDASNRISFATLFGPSSPLEHGTHYAVFIEEAINVPVNLDNLDIQFINTLASTVEFDSVATFRNCNYIAGDTVNFNSTFDAFGSVFSYQGENFNINSGATVANCVFEGGTFNNLSTTFTRFYNCHWISTTFFGGTSEMLVENSTVRPGFGENFSAGSTILKLNGVTIETPSSFTFSGTPTIGPGCHIITTNASQNITFDQGGTIQGGTVKPTGNIVVNNVDFTIEKGGQVDAPGTLTVANNLIVRQNSTLVTGGQTTVTGNSTIKGNSGHIAPSKAIGGTDTVDAATFGYYATSI